MTNTLSDRILEGIDGGVNRQWRYTKNLLHVKPEYLLTISVADALTNGFDSYHGMDISIKLEEPVNKTASKGLLHIVGFSKFFTFAREIIKRRDKGRGKADIVVECCDAHFVIELKGLDPSASDVKYDIERFISFLTIYSGQTNIKSCSLAFPSTTDCREWINKQVAIAKLAPTLRHSVVNKFEETHEDPEDGIHCYYGNVLTIDRI